MLNEVLLDIGGVVKADVSDKIGVYMIVGKRVLNPNSLRVWDYMAVPYPEGYKNSPYRNGDNEIETNENVVFFNHTDIEVIQSEVRNDWLHNMGKNTHPNT